MIKRFLGRNREYKHLLKELDSYVSMTYGEYVVLNFHDLDKLEFDKGV